MAASGGSSTSSPASASGTSISKSAAMSVLQHYNKTNNQALASWSVAVNDTIETGDLATPEAAMRILPKLQQL